MEFQQKISEEIAKQKYYLHGETSKKEVLRAVAEEIASVEKTPELQKKWSNKFFDLMDRGLFIPGGRILANARKDSLLKNYNNCFTIDIEDSMDSITNSLKEYMTILKTGGGVGFDISKPRPKGSPISSGGQSSGPMSFLEIFDSASKTIRVGGGRRGASIAIMRCDHPDIEEFITYKQGDENKRLTQFNISVGITDDFMHAVENDEDWDLVWGGKVYKTVKAKYIYNLITENAFIHNEPGVLFLDTVEYFNNGSWAFKMDRTNPCGEITMPSYSLCCLSSLNLSRFVKHPFTNEAHIDLDEISEAVRIGIRFLDNVLDATDYPLEKIELFSKLWRRVGLGITGLGDMFAMLRYKYGDENSLWISEKIASTIMNSAYLTSVELAKEKGAFPEFNAREIIEANFIKGLDRSVQDAIAKFGLRNIGLLTIAPTGTTSLTMGENCSSGVEPIFSLQYDRRIKDLTVAGQETERSETVYDYAWLKYQETLDIEKDSEVPEYFVTTMDIAAEDSIAIQSIWQKYIDHSISKTLNLSPGTTKKQYDHLFHEAWKNKLKGFTTFNPSGCGSLDTEVLTEKGVMTFLDIFEDQGYLLDDLYELEPGWLPINKSLKVYTNTKELKEVSSLFLKGSIIKLVEIIMEGGETLKLTPEHELQLKSGEWKKVSDLHEGDEIRDVYIR